MALALERARRARDRDEVPVGCVIVHGEALLADGWNECEERSDPTAHAEILAIRRGVARTGYARLLDATLYCTLEPCFMCAGAIVLARLARVVFATRDPKFGAVRSLGTILEHTGLNHRVEVDEGVLQEEAAELLRSFFRERRERRSGG